MNPITPNEVAQRVKNGKVVVFTGAGMSTESGLPDFRSQGGLWAGKDPAKIASTFALERNFDEFTEFYRHRIVEKNRHTPHEGYRILADWENRGLVEAVVTQNVDGYHSRAGSKKVYEIHGSLAKIYCMACGRTFSEERYLERNFCDCGGKIRPGIVLFGENLPMDVFGQALESLHDCETLLVIGTSLQVSPANMLPREAKQYGAQVILINREPVENPYAIDYWIKGSAKEALAAIDEAMKTVG